MAPEGRLDPARRRSRRSAALAQNLNKERGNILAVDWNAMQVRLKDPQGRERTWPVSKDAVVEFNDKTSSFPNPKLQDLVPPMYVHFTFNADTKEIVKFEVAEVGFEPGASRDRSRRAAGQRQAGRPTVDHRRRRERGPDGSADRSRDVTPTGSSPRPCCGLQGRRPRQLQVEKQGDKDVVTADEPQPNRSNEPRRDCERGRDPRRGGAGGWDGSIVGRTAGTVHRGDDGHCLSSGIREPGWQAPRPGPAAPRRPAPRARPSPAARRRSP